MKNIFVISLIEKFIKKEDISLSLVNKIEVILDEDFSDDEEIQNLVLMLASYRPGGGQFLYNEDQLTSALEIALKIISKK